MELSEEERRERQKTGEITEAGRQQPWQQQAVEKQGGGSWSQRAPGRKQRRGGGKSSSYQALLQHLQSWELQQLIKELPLSQPMWQTLNGLRFMGPLGRQPHTHTHTRL